MKLLARAAITIATLSALAGEAQAWTLAYDVPAGCDAEDAFRARAEAQRTRADGPGDAAVRVSARIGEGGRWRLHLEVDVAGAAPGVRELEGASCREVTEAAALIVAFSLDGEAPAPEPPRLPPPVPRPAFTAARDPQPGVLGSEVPSPPVWLVLGLAGGLDDGTLPAIAPGMRAELALGYRRISLGLGVASWARVEEVDADGQGMSATAWQGQVTARVRTWSRLELGAHLEIGQVDAIAVGVDTRIPRTVGWQAVAGSLLWRQPLWANLEFMFEVEGLWPFSRPSFVVDGETRFSPGLSARGWTGLAWRFL
jgi:hypothetical protein